MKQIEYAQEIIDSMVYFRPLWGDKKVIRVEITKPLEAKIYFSDGEFGTVSGLWAIELKKLLKNN